MEIIFGIIIFIASLYIEGSIGVSMNMPGMGCLFAVCLFGTALLWEVRRGKRTTKGTI